MTAASPARAARLYDVLGSDAESVRFIAALDLVTVTNVADIPALINAFDHPSSVVCRFHTGDA